MPKKKVEVYDKDKLIYPFIENDHVTFSNGMKVSEMLDKSISMPTIAHNETSFKVGDSDVSSSIVDSSVSTMVIKGQTYQNILPEPSTPVLTNNKEMFKVNERLDPNVEIVDGVSKSAILKGNTLVNLTQPSLRVWTMNLNSDTASLKATTDEFIIDWSKGIPYNAWIQARNDNSPVFGGMIKPNTDYTFIIRVLENNPTFEGVTVTGNVANLQMWGLRGYHAKSFSLQAGVTGTIALKYNFNTLSTAIQDNENIFGIAVQGTASNGTKTIDGGKLRISKDVIVLEGDYTNNYQYIPYFEGMQSVKMPVLTTTGKNLFPNIKFIHNRALQQGSGNIANVTTDDWACEDYLNVPQQKTLYTNMLYIGLTWTKICFYDENKKFISSRMSNDTVIFPENSKYWRVGAFVTPENSHLLNQIMLCDSMEEARSAYEPYKSNILTTTGKNLFNMNRRYDNLTDSQATVIQDTNQITVSSAESGIYVNANFILDKDFFAGKTVTGSCLYESDEKDIGTVQIVYQDGDGEYHYQWIRTPTTFTFPNSFIGDVMLSVSANNTGTPQSNTVTVKNIQLELGSTATPYEPYSEVVLRGIGDVKDTLDCLTGEVTERIGEVVLDGSVVDNTILRKNGSSFLMIRFDKIGFKHVNSTNDIVSSKLRNVKYYSSKPFNVGDVVSDAVGWGFGICFATNETATKDEAISYLNSLNPIVQGYLAQESVKTVDLSSSGNWEKVVLDGSEDESWEDGDNGLSKTHRFYVRIPNSLSGNHRPITDSTYFTAIEAGTSSQDTPCVQVASNKIYFRIERQIANDLTSFKTWLQSNPITVWYQTATHQDSTQVKQPIFFKDGLIQLSSGADNSLIPTLDYQAKTSNSYVMDLMKANTRYTMKAKSASGNFTLGGSSYSLGTNRVFSTTGAAFNANNMMVVTGSYEDLMILEGDVTDKTTPYFKGIKSAFEDKDEIEVLSTGKNLFDGELEMATIETVAGEKRPSTSHVCSVNFIKVKPSSAVILTNNNGYVGVIHEYGKDYNYIKYTASATEITKTTLTADTEYVLIRTTDASKATDLSTKFLLEVANSKTDYEPHKSNNTKIPLLSPLRSLPNGVRDEIILDRENNKAKIVQRVGMGVLDGSAHEAWDLTANDDSGVRFANNVNNMYAFPKANGNPDGKVFTNSFLPCVFTTKTKNVLYKQAFSVWDNKIVLYLEPSIANISQLRSYLSQNPITVQYELAIPIITEVDLEGFPYIYKDGHIFLNSEIAPTTEVTYSINQGQQISASNEDIIRHEKELTYLQKLIAQYVQVNYESVLLSLKV